MLEIKKIIPEFEFENHVGKIIQLVHDNWKQVNVLLSNKGKIRGGHYHKINKEAFYIISGKVKAKIEKDGELCEQIFTTGQMFVFLPFQVHDMFFLEDTVMVQLYSHGVEYCNGEKDIYN